MSDIFDNIGSGATFEELPEEFKTLVKREYFERSPWASILVLENGRCLVRKMTTGTFIPCQIYNDALSTRELLK